MRVDDSYELARFISTHRRQRLCAMLLMMVPRSLQDVVFAQQRLHNLCAMLLMTPSSLHNMYGPCLRQCLWPADETLAWLLIKPEFVSACLCNCAFCMYLFT